VGLIRRVLSTQGELLEGSKGRKNLGIFPNLGRGISWNRG